jgi:hypothetical protein
VGIAGWAQMIRGTRNKARENIFENMVLVLFVATAGI